MVYTKQVQGYVEQTFDEEGTCLSQKFFPREDQPVDRRDESDDLIEDEATLKILADREKDGGTVVEWAPPA